MTVDVDPRWSCYRKKAYPSEQAAHKVMLVVLEHNPEKRLNVYSCGHCGLWHIGRRAAWNEED